MPPVVIDVRQAADSRDIVHRAVQALVEGQLVVFPTETVYGLAASALNQQAVERLLSVKSRAAEQPLTLSIRSAEDAWDYVPDVPPLARRLARRCWPGPVTLVLKDNHQDSLLHQLPKLVQQAVCPGETIGLRVPAHALVLDVLDMLAGPIVMSSANRSGDDPAKTAEQAVEALGNDVQLVINDGQSRFGQASSVVQIDSSGMKVLREGVVSQDAIQRLSTFLVVVVCTGNTCRSPMAEAMLRKRMADKVGCRPAELEDRGIVVMSAGIAAMAGGRASAESVEIMNQRELDITDHASQPVTDRLVRHADVIFTMTRGHRDSLLAHWPDATNRTFLLSADGRDVADPIGGPVEVYHRCADQIDAALEQRVAEMDLGSLRPNYPAVEN